MWPLSGHILIDRAAIIAAVSSADTSDGERLLRELAGAGRLAAAVREAGPARHAALTSAAYAIAWPVVFQRVTRPVERRRGHWRCAAAMSRLADECADGFHDDVEAVVADLLAHAEAPIRNVEAWLCGRLTKATVDGYRRRRGQRGALQRPRMPGWLAAELGRDPWLMELALHVLDWAGVPHTAGLDVWPLESWVLRRAEVTGDWPGSDHRAVLREVDRVLTAMRRRPAWYADHVERPLGAKVPPVAATPGDAPGDPRPLIPVGPDEAFDSRLRELADAAVAAIAAALGRGEDPRETVVRIVVRMFGAGTGGDELARMPGTVPALDERVSGLLADPAARERIVAAILAVVAVPW